MKNFNWHTYVVKATIKRRRDYIAECFPYGNYRFQKWVDASFFAQRQEVDKATVLFNRLRSFFRKIILPFPIQWTFEHPRFSQKLSASIESLIMATHTMGRKNEISARRTSSAAVIRNVALGVAGTAILALILATPPIGIGLATGLGLIIGSSAYLAFRAHRKASIEHNIMKYVQSQDQTLKGQEETFQYLYQQLMHLENAIPRLTVLLENHNGDHAKCGVDIEEQLKYLQDGILNQYNVNKKWAQQPLLDRIAKVELPAISSKYAGKVHGNSLPKGSKAELTTLIEYLTKLRKQILNLDVPELLIGAQAEIDKESQSKNQLELIENKSPTTDQTKAHYTNHELHQTKKKKSSSGRSNPQSPAPARKFRRGSSNDGAMSQMGKGSADSRSKPTPHGRDGTKEVIVEKSNATPSKTETKDHSKSRKKTKKDKRRSSKRKSSRKKEHRKGGISKTSKYSEQNSEYDHLKISALGSSPSVAQKNNTKKKMTKRSPSRSSSRSSRRGISSAS